MNTWKYNNTPFTEQPDACYTGFVYLITNLSTGRKYIGKKTFWSTKTTQKTVIIKSTGIKKKKKIKTQIPSDWLDYFGSNDDLKKDVEALGAECFSREILRLCHTKGEMSYIEAKLQFENDVIMKPTEWYNHWIMVRVHRTHMKTGIV